MLPVTHGLKVTRAQILLYSLLLVPVTLLSSLLGLTGWIYGGAAALLGAVFIALAVRVWRSTAETAAAMIAEKKLFRFSLYYLAGIFAALVADRLILS